MPYILQLIAFGISGLISLLLIAALAEFLVAAVLRCSIVFFPGWEVRWLGFKRTRTVLAFLNLGFFVLRSDSPEEFKAALVCDVEKVLTRSANRRYIAGRFASKLSSSPFRPYWFWAYRRAIANLWSHYADNAFWYQYNLARKQLGETRLAAYSGDPYVSQSVIDRFEKRQPAPFHGSGKIAKA